MKDVAIQAFVADVANQGLTPDLNFMLPDGRKVAAVWLQHATQFIPNPNYSELVKFVKVESVPYNWVAYLNL